MRWLATTGLPKTRLCRLHLSSLVESPRLQFAPNALGTPEE